MARIVTIHQPNYLPWIGLFSKIQLADTLIILDTVQYTSGGVTNRNKIRTRNGWCYLTVPVDNRFLRSRIMDLPIAADGKWKKDHWSTLRHNYAKTAFFEDYKDFFKQLYDQNLEYLWQVNEKIIRFLLECFNIRVEVLKASQLDIDLSLKKTDLLLACLKGAGADVYVSGPSGRDYLQPEKFAQNNMVLKFAKFLHPVYRQRYPGFEPNMAAIDLLFNTGPQASEIIRNSGTVDVGSQKDIC